VNILLS